MQKFFDSVLLDSGQPATGVSVLVTAFGGGATTIYSDNGSTPRSNPITTDANGYFEFYAADGRYTLQISGTGISPRTIADVLLEDPLDGNAMIVSTLTATGQVSLGGVAGAESVRVAQAPTNSVNRIQEVGAITLGEPRIGTEGGDTDINFGIYAKGAGSIRWLTGGGALEQFRVSHTAVAVNFLGVTGAIATAAPSFNAQGSDTNIGVNYNSKGTGAHTFNNAVTLSAGSLTVTNGGVQAGNGNLVANTVGTGLRIREGANSKQDTATLVAGTVTINNTSITANSRVFAFCQTPGGTPGFLRCSARVVGTSYTILSSSGTDTSTIAVLITEPAP